MEIGSLEIILAVVAVFVVFGPKELPRRGKKPKAIKVKHVERAALVPRMPSQFAAGRAPSPLQLRAAERPMRTPGQAASGETPRFASGERDGSPLPHEMLRV